VKDCLLELSFLRKHQRRHQGRHHHRSSHSFRVITRIFGLLKTRKTMALYTMIFLLERRGEACYMTWKVIRGHPKYFLTLFHWVLHFHSEMKLKSLKCKDLSSSFTLRSFECLNGTTKDKLRLTNNNLNHLLEWYQNKSIIKYKSWISYQFWALNLFNVLHIKERTVVSSHEQ
jgi:hypothetical protein